MPFDGEPSLPTEGTSGGDRLVGRVLRQRRGDTGLWGGRVETTGTQAMIVRDSNDCRSHPSGMVEGLLVVATRGLRLFPATLKGGYAY
jgi:hypothetical protein